MRFISLLIICLSAFLTAPGSDARKIKLSLKTTDVRNSSKTEKRDSKNPVMEGEKVDAGKQFLFTKEDGSGIIFDPDSISFAGYEKEASASRETVLVVNKTDFAVRGIHLVITYKDMKGRMLHSRKIQKNCHIPAKETRMIEIPTWDKQKTYYYYLGNAPRKVATPYKVEVAALSYWIDY